jgi:CheY-like chemotaxis protein
MSKLLLVEDDPVVTEMYANAFKEAQFEIQVASNGKDGLVRAAEWKPDIILLDIMMPEMNGLITLRHLKQLPETAHIPVILLTVLPEELHSREDVQRADAYINKTDYGPQELIEKVNEVLLKTAKPQEI